MKAPVLKPIRHESRNLIEKINDVIQQQGPGDDSKIIIMDENDMKRMIEKIIIDVIVQMDASYVRKDQIGPLLQSTLQDMVKGRIDPGGKK